MPGLAVGLVVGLVGAPEVTPGTVPDVGEARPDAVPRLLAELEDTPPPSRLALA